MFPPSNNTGIRDGRPLSGSCGSICFVPAVEDGMDGRLKAGPKEFASSRSGALCFLRPVCFNIVQKSGSWASGKSRTVAEPRKYCTRLKKKKKKKKEGTQKIGQVFMAMSILPASLLS